MSRLNLLVWAGAITMPFMRRLKSIGQATVILLALGPFLPLSFLSEICEAAIERLSLFVVKLFGHLIKPRAAPDFYTEIFILRPKRFH